MNGGKLKAVPTSGQALDIADDIYAKDMAKIASIDWDRLHITADRRAPVDIPDRPTRRVLGLVYREEIIGKAWQP